jgi:quercetin dioxygenase-like cupin family protein
MQNNMKDLLKVAVTFISLMAVNSAYAQDWVKADPEGKKILVDNDHFRLVEITLLPGKKEPLHTHPEYIEYFMESGKMIVVYPGKEPIIWNVEKGKAYSGKPEPPHTIENAEAKPIKLLLTEMKDKPYKPN